ncbi:MAG: cysteine-rich VLP domain-containing protein [Oscillospiraceae bacterium]|nr:cysteine-rich VLP domain-containing protein [Oscillospiraceae bacterium]
MTPDQLRRLKALIKNMCCNYIDGKCLILDCPCPQMITYSLICNWCENAVLPQNAELCIEISKPERVKKCAVCGKRFIYKSNSAKYCKMCRIKVLHRQKADYQQK